MRKLTRFWNVYLKLIALFIPNGPLGDVARGNLYKPFLKSCGKNFKLGTNAFVFNPNDLSVGDNVYIGFNSYIGKGDVRLDDEVLIGNFVSITASDHLRKDHSFRFGGNKTKPIHIGKGVWVAAHVCITNGVSIGAGSLIAAGAVVTESFPPDSFVAGIPGKLIKALKG